MTKEDTKAKAGLLLKSIKAKEGRGKFAEGLLCWPAAALLKGEWNEKGIKVHTECLYYQ